jgi:cathepsin L
VDHVNEPLASGLFQSGSNAAAQQRSVLEPMMFAEMLRRYEFVDFVREFHRDYKFGTSEWNRREGVFNTSKMSLIDFHLGPRKSWRLGVTQFMDYTKEEFKGLLGYKRSGGRQDAGVANPSISVVRTQDVLDTVVNGINASGLSGLIRDQGPCGSCWAMAAASTLEAHVERQPTILAALHKRLDSSSELPTLSTQTILSCTENPRHCGGKGGCDGATVQLAYDMIKERGIPLASQWSYLAADRPCPTTSGMFETAVVGITGYVELPKNKLGPLKRAVITHGPVAIAVAANDWSFYIDGIMSDAASDASKFLLNHAVTLIGFNAEQGQHKNYWLIKNSWGRNWGEDGNIRVEMKADEEKHCGWDEDTHVGMACDGDANRDWACGTFGILYNGVFPKGVHLKGS